MSALKKNKTHRQHRARRESITLFPSAGTGVTIFVLHVFPQLGSIVAYIAAQTNQQDEEARYLNSQQVLLSI